MNYNEEQIGVLRMALLHILTNGPRMASYGLCRNLTYSKIVLAYNDTCNGTTYDQRLDGYKFVADESVDWEHAHKNAVGGLYPWFVPHEHGVGWWEGANLAMRQNLIQYLLGRLDGYEAQIRADASLAD